MEFFDSHTHLTDEIYDKSVEQIVNDAKLNNVNYIVDIGYNESTSSAAVKNAEMFESVYATVGLHPENVDEYTGNFDYIYELTKSSKVVAIGEIGLDYYHTKENKDKQIELFEKMLTLAKKHGLPAIVHSRKSMQDTFDTLKKHDVVGSLHCYQGSAEMAREFVKLGFFIGIGGSVTYDNSKKIIKTLNEIDITRVLVETDSPYLSPEPLRGRRNDSRNVKYMAQKIADIKGLSLEQVAEATYNNAKRIFRIK